MGVCGLGPTNGFCGGGVSVDVDNMGVRGVVERLARAVGGVPCVV